MIYELAQSNNTAFAFLFLCITSLCDGEQRFLLVMESLGKVSSHQGWNKKLETQGCIFHPHTVYYTSALAAKLLVCWLTTLFWDSKTNLDNLLQENWMLIGAEKGFTAKWSEVKLPSSFSRHFTPFFQGIQCLARCVSQTHIIYTWILMRCTV